MAERHEVDVLCIGFAAYDLIFLVDHHPGEDEKMFAQALWQCGGGPAANAAVAVARLGGTSAFIGYLGQDLYGNVHLQELEQEGVDTRGVYRGNAPTPLSTILVKPDGRRTVVNYRDVKRERATAVSPDAERLVPRVLLFDGHEPELSRLWLDAVQSRNVATVLDAGSVHPGTLALMERVDYLVCSEKFAREFTQENDTEAWLPGLSKVNKNVVITLGARGLVWNRSGSQGVLAAFPVHAVDTTGAGDAFHGAFALAMARGTPWMEALRFASAAAALTCTAMGARPALPKGEAVRQWLESDEPSGTQT